MSDTDIFLSTNPAEPWSYYPLGLPALGVVAAALVLLTLWTYLGRPQVTGRRLATILALRLLALLVALVTAVRPSVGVQEEPKVPSTLLVGIDMSETMTVPDELGNRPRIDAVRRVLDKCQPTIEELRTEQNVNVVLYGFGLPGFNEGTDRYDPKAPAKLPRSDYGTYLNRTYDRWQVERFVRGNLVIGDGRDNGSAYSAAAEAERWRKAGRPVSTFAVGRKDTRDDARDVAVAAVSVTSGNPDGSVNVKTDFTLKAVINAFQFQGATFPVQVWFDTGDGYKLIREETVTLSKEKDNEVELTLQAPEKPGEIKVKVEVPADRVPGDVAPSNNALETYLTVKKEGMRVLLVNRLSFEQAALRRALQADAERIKVFQVIRQTDDPASPEEAADFDFDRQAYDVIILGNVSAKQLTSIDPQLPRKIADQVLNKGVGLLMTGGHATFLGTPGVPGATGWRDVREIKDILPVDLDAAPPVPDSVFTGESARYQYLPTFDQRFHYLNRIGDTPEQSLDNWRRLNDKGNLARFTGLSKVGPAKPLSTIFAVASPDPVNLPIPLKADEQRKYAPLLVGHQIGVGSRGRVLVMAAQDTYLWQHLGQPKSNDGVQIHARFWRQMVRWLAHQEEDEGAAFAKPDWRNGPVGTKQTIRVGLRGPGGAPVKAPKFDVKVIAPGQDEATAPALTPVLDPDGGFKVPYDPAVPGEYTVKVSATGEEVVNGKPTEVKGEATARFIASPMTSDEMLRKSADHEFLARLAAAGGGKAYRLDDLPAFLKELKTQPLDLARPKPKYHPDWRRDHSGPFLPGWLVLFAVLLGTEWGLRRWWGLV